MSTHALTLTYAAPPSTEGEPLDLLLIEQQDWRLGTGLVTKAELVGTLAHWLYGEDYQSRVDCGFVGADLVCGINVYPRVAGLVYQFHTSHGTLSERSVELAEIEESCNFALEAEAQPRYPARSIASAEWLGECYDLNGNVIPPPALTISGGSIRAAVACYGSVNVRYTTERHTYLLTCPRREEALDNHYSAAVYGVYAGGLNWLEIEMPPGIDAFEADPDAECGWGSSQGSITAPDREPAPVEDGNHDRKTVVDYCSQQVASDEVY